MYTNSLDIAFAYESERRKDEMRAAAQSSLARQASGEHKSSILAARPLDALLTLLAFFFLR
jgi:hypothetical protein